MSKKILSIFLAVMLLMGGLAVGTVAAGSSVTLYAGGGSIYATDWTLGSSGAYVGDGNLPMPVMAGATFEGWYENSGLTDGLKQAGEAPVASTYYAKWSVAADTANNGKMAYRYTVAGGTANGLKEGQDLSAFFVNGGFYTRYSLDTPPAAGGTVAYSGDNVRFENTELFTKVNGTTDTYLARTMNLEGNFVRYTYHVQNRGNAASAAFWLGASADASLGNNDHVPLKQISNSGYQYLSMVDEPVANEFRLYYTGASLTTPNRLWWGGFSENKNKNSMNFLRNTFNDGKDALYKDGIDSAFAFSWNVPALKPGETKSYSVLLGVGSPKSFNTTYKLRYDLNGAAGTAPTDSNGYPIGAEVKVTSTPPTRSGYTFIGWSTEADGSGTIAAAGGKLPIYGDTTLYAIWAATPHELVINVTEDGAPLTGVAVTLWQNGRQKYELLVTDGVCTAIVQSGAYDVYVNGIKHSKQIIVNKETEETVSFKAATVNVKLDGAPWGGHNIALYRDDAKMYNLLESAGVYQKGLLEDGTYDVYLDGADIEKTLTTGIPLDLNFYTAEVNVTKDGRPWADALVTVGGLKASLNNGKYTAIVPEGTTHAVVVNGEELGNLDGSYEFNDANYYTVTFYDGLVPYGATTFQKPQIVRGGEKAMKPEQNPVHSGGSAVFGDWTDKSSVVFDFDTEITTTTGIYASWSTPIVVPGAISKESTSTYKLPNLKITGYDASTNISGFTVAITGGGSVADSGTGSTKMGSGTTNLSVSFSSTTSIEDAELYLRNLVFTIGSSKQTVTITVFGN